MSEIQAPVASFTFSRFEAHRDDFVEPRSRPSLLMHLMNSSPVMIDVHMCTNKIESAPILKMLTANLGDPACDAVGGGLNGIAGEMRIASGGLDLGMTQELADHGQTFADQ